MKPTAQRERLLAQVAAECRKVYIQERIAYQDRIGEPLTHYRPGPRWDGGETSSGRNYEAIWPKVAKFMLEHSLDATRAIRARFRLAMPTNDIVLPNMIAQLRYVDVYRNGEDDKEDLSIAWELQWHYFRSDVSRQRNLAAACGKSLSEQMLLHLVLMDQASQISALFRYHLAVEHRLDKIARSWRAAACAQYYASADAYDAVLGDRLPEDFRVQARQG